jgi:hypothetical protein
LRIGNTFKNKNRLRNFGQGENEKQSYEEYIEVLKVKKNKN